MRTWILAAALVAMAAGAQAREQRVYLWNLGGLQVGLTEMEGPGCRKGWNLAYQVAGKDDAFLGCWVRAGNSFVVDIDAIGVNVYDASIFKAVWVKDAGKKGGK